MAIFGQNLAFLASLTIYIELEGHMMAQNDTLDETNNLAPRNVFSSGTELKECIWRSRSGRRSRRRHFTYLVSLAIYIDLEGRMMTQNDTLDETERTSH